MPRKVLPRHPGQLYIGLLLTLSILFPTAVPAGWPTQIDDQPLPSLAPMLEKVLPAVVNVSVTSPEKSPNSLFQDPFFRQFFDIPENMPGTEQAVGSGVIIDAREGYIVTNYHVIHSAQSISITLYNGIELEASLIGADEATDIALLKVDSSKLQQFPLGNSDALRIGDFVVAVGNPFGLGHSVTSGIVSALGRTGLGIERYEDFIQTDASINPGNSGGALVNLRGELVGINAAIIAQGGGNVGIGFSIPINRVRQLLEQLKEFGNIQRGFLGVVSEDLPPAYTSAKNAPTRSGALITEVIAHSPAQQASIQPGDIVIQVGEEKIDSASDLRNTLGLVRAGEHRRIRYWRGNQLNEVQVQIKDPDIQRKLSHRFYEKLNGASFLDVTLSTRKGPRGAILISDVERDSRAEAIGFRRDDIIIAANRHNIENLDHLREVIDQAGDQLLITLQRNGVLIEIEIP